MADLETLTLQINTESQQATRAISSLSKKLDALSASIAKLETGKLVSLANGLDTLNMAIYSLNTTSTTYDYKRVVNNIARFATINVSQINNLSTSLTTLATSFTGMGAAADISENVSRMIQAINSLGYKSTARALENIPKLEKELSSLIKTFAQLPNVNQSIIDFTKSLSSLVGTSNKVSKVTEGVSKSIDKFGTSATHATKKAFKLSSAVGKVYAEYWLLMRAFSGIKKAFVSAADYLEAYNYFDVVAEKIGSDTFRKAGTGSAEEYADAFTSEMKRKLKQMSGLELDLENRLIKTTNAKSLGLNITEITQYQASIASITNAMGQAQEVSTATAKAFSMLAADMGSLRNVDYEQVAQNLQSALTGQARALYKYGIDLTEATLEQYAYANGVNKAVSEMTQAEKAQLRLLAILDQSKVAWGDLANTINSPANQLRQLSNNFSELGTVLGQLFVPLMQNVLPWINGLSIALKQLAIDIATLLGIQLNIDEFGKGFSDTIDVDTEAVDDLNKSMKETKKNIREFDELKVIGGDKSKAGSGLADQIDLTKQIVAATSEYERVWDEAYRQMENKAQAIAEALKSVLDPIRQIVEDFHIGDFFKAGEDVSDLVISIFDFISNAISKVDWKAIGIKIGEFFEGIKWGEILKSIGSVIGSAIQGAFDIWTGSFSVAPMETAIITAFALLKFTGLGEVLSSNIQGTITKWFKKKGIDSNFLQKAGIGAIEVGLGVSFWIDNVKDIKSSKKAAFGLESLGQTAISSLLTAAGFKSVASALGMSLGPLGFAVTTGLVLTAELVSAVLSIPDAYEIALQIAREQYEWVEKYHLDTINVLATVEIEQGHIDVQFNQLDDLADKVYDLSLNYDKLTDGEKNLLKYYSEELIGIMPELADKIDKVTGAYKGTREELEKLIEAQKIQIKQDAVKDILTEVYTRQYEVKAKVDEVQGEYDAAWAEWRSYSQQLKAIGITDETLQILKDTGDWDQAIWNQVKYSENMYEDAAKLQEAVSKIGYKDVPKIWARVVASNEALDTLKTDYESLNETISYYTGQLEETVGGSLDSITGFVGDTDKDINDTVKKSKLPKEVDKTLNNVTETIKTDGKASKDEMNDLFTKINNAFAGLGDGKVPAEVQTTMDNIKKAILDNSPALCQYMQLLKIQMEQAFTDAHYTGSDLIWNPNNISARLGVDFGKIEESLRYTAKPALGSLEDDLKELFGGTLPEEVDKKLKALAKTIKNGGGQKAVTDALYDLRYTFLSLAADGGMYIDLGLGYAIDEYGRYVYAAMGNVLDETKETTLKEIKANSPSKVYREIGKYIPEGLALGITDEVPYAVKSISDLAASIQSVFTGFTYNIPNLGLNNTYGASYYNNGNPYADAGSSLYDAMSSMYRNQNGQTEVVFRVEGDPYGIFKVVREENNKYRNRTHRSAFN